MRRKKAILGAVLVLASLLITGSALVRQEHVPSCENDYLGWCIFE